MSASTQLPRLMTIFAHPDDETFSMAGTIIHATGAGHPVALVCATRGEVGEIADPSLATPETLGQVREQELRRAAEVMGVSDVSFLDYIDGQLPQAPKDEAVGKIVAHLRRFRPDVVVTFPANGGYGHVDHIAIHHLTLAAITAAADAARYPEAGAAHQVRKLYFSAFSRSMMLQMRDMMRQAGKEDFTPGGDAATIPVEEMGTPDEQITTNVTLTEAEFDQKSQAIMQHKTQLGGISQWLTADREQLMAMQGTEAFELATAPYTQGTFATPESNVFDGL